MDWKYFYIGLSLLLFSLLIYRYLLKGVPMPSMYSNNEDSFTLAGYISAWGGVILGIIGGIGLILRSL